MVGTALLFTTRYLHSFQLFDEVVEMGCQCVIIVTGVCRIGTSESSSVARNAAEAGSERSELVFPHAAVGRSSENENDIFFLFQGLGRVTLPGEVLSS